MTSACCCGAGVAQLVSNARTTIDMAARIFIPPRPTRQVMTAPPTAGNPLWRARSQPTCWLREPPCTIMTNLEPKANLSEPYSQTSVFPMLTHNSVRGAPEQNLKGVNIDIPRESLTVITGLSGSGKSSLAFDTIYAEGQRR